MLVSICFPSMCCWVHYTLWANSLTNVHICHMWMCVCKFSAIVFVCCLSVCLSLCEYNINYTLVCVCVSACICVCVLSDFKLWQTFWQSVECHYILIRVCVCSLVLFVLTCSVWLFKGWVEWEVCVCVCVCVLLYVMYMYMYSSVNWLMWVGIWSGKIKRRKR